MRYSEIMTESATLESVTADSVLAVLTKDADLQSFFHDLHNGSEDKARRYIEGFLPLAKETLGLLSFPLPLFRGIRERPRLNGLGRHWTSELSVAKAWVQESKTGYVVEIVVSQDKIDWVASVARFIYFQHEEDEVVLFPGEQVTVRNLLLHVHGGMSQTTHRMRPEQWLKQPVNGSARI